MVEEESVRPRSSPGGKGWDMKTPVFTGTATAMVTPYNEEGVDYALFSRLIDRQAENGVSAVAVCATTGEAPVLTDPERSLLIATAVRSAAGRMKVVAGIGGNDTAKAAKAAREAEILGADAVLLTAPYYNRASRNGLFDHFTYVAERIGIPLIVYNVPGRTSVACDAALYARLAEHPNINGVKEASGDISLVSRTRALCGDEFHIWSGNDDQTLPMMALGALGVISVASNVIPGEITALTNACLRGDLAAAGALHHKYARLFEALFIEVNPIPVKAALQLMGLDHGEYRLPLCPMESAHLETLKNCLRELEIIL